MKHSRTAPHPTHLTKLIWPVLIIAPLLLTLAWGQHFSPDVYILLQYARGIATGGGLSLSAVGEFPTTSLTSPLFAFIVGLSAWLSVNPAWAALVMSAIGWIVAAFSFLAIGMSLHRPRGAVVAALLLSFNPAIITSLGSPASWTVALSWMTIALLLRRRFVVSIFTFLLLAALLIPWPLSSGWSHLSLYVGAMAWSVLLFIAGIGADWLAEKLVERDLIRLTLNQISTLLLATVFIIFGFWQGISLWQLFQERSERFWQLEEEAASWLLTETDTTATLLASEKIGYLAQRRATNLPNVHQLETATAVQALLQSHPVDYLVTTNDLPWQQLRELVWFRQAYEPLEQFNTPYLPQTPITIWSYRQPVAGLGQRQTINARVPDRLWIIGYQIGPQQVRAGESVQMVLYIEAPEATFELPTPFQAIVRLISQVDNSTVREWTVDLPQTVSPQDWQANEVIVEQFPLVMPDDLEAGAYLLNLSLLGPDSENLWPMSLDNDFNRLDRIPTGYVIVPVEDKLEDIQPIKAVFGSSIHLPGFATSEAEAGETLDVTLVWQAEQSVNEDYVVFVHLVDSNGLLVANHDGIPGNGRFPTRAWQPGITIPDTHTILLPPDLPDGEYVLKVGLYDPDTGQRLQVTTVDGSVPDDSSMVLTTISRP